MRRQIRPPHLRVQLVPLQPPQRVLLLPEDPVADRKRREETPVGRVVPADVMRYQEVHRQVRLARRVVQQREGKQAVCEMRRRDWPALRTSSAAPHVSFAPIQA